MSADTATYSGVGGQGSRVAAALARAAGRAAHVAPVVPPVGVRAMSVLAAPAARGALATGLYGAPAAIGAPTASPSFMSRSPFAARGATPEHAAPSANVAAADEIAAADSGGPDADPPTDAPAADAEAAAQDEAVEKVFTDYIGVHKYLEYLQSFTRRGQSRGILGRPGARSFTTSAQQSLIYWYRKALDELKDYFTKFFGQQPYIQKTDGTIEQIPVGFDQHVASLVEAEQAYYKALADTPNNTEEIARLKQICDDKLKKLEDFADAIKNPSSYDLKQLSPPVVKQSMGYICGNYLALIYLRNLLEAWVEKWKNKNNLTQAQVAEKEEEFKKITELKGNNFSKAIERTAKYVVGNLPNKNTPIGGITMGEINTKAQALAGIIKGVVDLLRSNEKAVGQNGKKLLHTALLRTDWYMYFIRALQQVGFRRGRYNAAKSPYTDTDKTGKEIPAEVANKTAEHPYELNLVIKALEYLAEQSAREGQLFEVLSDTNFLEAFTAAIIFFFNSGPNGYLLSHVLNQAMADFFQFRWQAIVEEVRRGNPGLSEQEIQRLIKARFIQEVQSMGFTPFDAQNISLIITNVLGNSRPEIRRLTEQILGGTLTDNQETFLNRFVQGLHIQFYGVPTVPTGGNREVYTNSTFTSSKQDNIYGPYSILLRDLLREQLVEYFSRPLLSQERRILEKFGQFEFDGHFDPFRNLDTSLFTGGGTSDGLFRFLPGYKYGIMGLQPTGMMSREIPDVIFIPSEEPIPILPLEREDHENIKGAVATLKLILTLNTIIKKEQEEGKKRLLTLTAAVAGTALAYGAYKLFSRGGRYKKTRRISRLCKRRQTKRR